VVELVDALASGASGRKAVEVRVLSWAPFSSRFRSKRLLSCGGRVALSIFANPISIEE